jgi:hypothetical protein
LASGEIVWWVFSDWASVVRSDGSALLRLRQLLPGFDLPVIKVLQGESDVIWVTTDVPEGYGQAIHQFELAEGSGAWLSGVFKHQRLISVTATLANDALIGWANTGSSLSSAELTPAVIRLSETSIRPIREFMEPGYPWDGLTAEIIDIQPVD